MKKIITLIILIFLIQMSIAGAHHQINYFTKNKTIKEDTYNKTNTSYIIITTSNFEEALQDFKTWKEHPGFNIKITNISWISINYQGKDLQEKIRNFLIHKYEDWGIKYVLIVGSRDTIPMRRCDPINWEFGEYVVRVKAKDQYGAESDWSTLPIKIPMISNIDMYNSFIIRLITGIQI